MKNGAHTKARGWWTGAMHKKLRETHWLPRWGETPEDVMRGLVEDFGSEGIEDLAMFFLDPEMVRTLLTEVINATDPDVIPPDYRVFAVLGHGDGVQDKNPITIKLVAAPNVSIALNSSSDLPFPEGHPAANKPWHAFYAWDANDLQGIWNVLRSMTGPIEIGPVDGE